MRQMALWTSAYAGDQRRINAAVASNMGASAFVTMGGTVYSCPLRIPAAVKRQVP